MCEVDVGGPHRAEAVRCAGLLCMLGDSFQADAAGCSQRIALLRTALLTDARAPVCEAAARALCDLAVLRSSLETSLLRSLSCLAHGQELLYSGVKCFLNKIVSVFFYPQPLLGQKDVCPAVVCLLPHSICPSHSLFV